MTYEYQCDRCGRRRELSRPIAQRDNPVWCPSPHASTEEGLPVAFATPMRRLPSAPNIIGTPYHLQEGNRFRGDITDYKAYRRKYDKMHEKQTEQNREWSTIQAQMTGAEIVKADEPKPLIEMYKEAGGTVRG